jgi:hypothetical protein
LLALIAFTLVVFCAVAQEAVISATKKNKYFIRIIVRCYYDLNSTVQDDHLTNTTDAFKNIAIAGNDFGIG